MDLAPNQLRCQECWAVVDLEDFVICSNCHASFHPVCRENAGGCNSQGCGGSTSEPGAELLLNHDGAEDAEVDAIVRELLAERTEEIDKYNMGNYMGIVAILIFMGITGIVAAVIAATNFIGVGLGVGLVVVTGTGLGFCCLYAAREGRRHLNSVALVDSRLASLGRDRTGAPKTGAKKKAA